MSSISKRLRFKGSSQFKAAKKPVVIVSTTRPGDRTGLGSFACVRRQCLAWIRAMDGLIIVRYEHIGNEDRCQVYPRHSYEFWRDIITQMKKENRFCTLFVMRSKVEHTLNIPNLLEHEEIES
ncbi:hypothetical protein BJX61DRAFT_542844 [Aspergillus egyptiacus]|nr:hypothetical protein BJX61DRAFT_542844 [Aspergillus egyptiacus]